MPISHGSNRWTVIGANVERLPNERFTVTLNCRTHNLDSDWYANNEDKIFKDFGDAYSLPLDNGAGDAAAWSPQAGEAYPNLVLIETQYQGATGDDPSLIFVYETLTSTWTLEDEALSTVGENGLLILSEDLVAIGGTALPYDEDDIGVISKVIDGTTIYLAGIQDEGSQRKGEVTLLWAEAGILEVATPKVGGNQQVRVQALGLTATEVSTELSSVLSSHLLIDESESNYEGLNTSTYVFEVNDFDIENQSADGFKTVEQTSLSATNFTAGTIGSEGTGGYLTLYLTSEAIDNDGTIKKRVRKWSEAGVISIAPTENNFSLAKSYTYRTSGIKASDMSGLTTPSGGSLPADVTWFEPSVQFPSGFPTFTQVVLLESIGVEETQVKIDTRNEFFTVTDAGIMNCVGDIAASDTSGAASIWPRPSLEPVTYRKKATVEIYLTNIGTFDEVEVAYSEENIQWCSISFSNFYSSKLGQAASSSGSFRSFPNYLRGPTASRTEGTPIGTGIEYDAVAESYAEGTLHNSTDWATTGIYRVNLEEYTKDVNGNQLYLKTIVTFPEPTPDP